MRIPSSPEEVFTEPVLIDIAEVGAFAFAALYFTKYITNPKKFENLSLPFFWGIIGGILHYYPS